MCKFLIYRNICDDIVSNIHYPFFSANSNTATNKGNLDALWKLTNEDQSGVTKCQSCYGQGTMQNGKETGDKAFQDCKNGNAASMSCPGYAQKACFSHETISEDNRDGTTTINYRRGCSHFEYEYENRKCNNYNFGIENVEECKDTCTSNDCNKEEIVVPANCYTCDYTWDQEVKID